MISIRFFNRQYKQVRPASEKLVKSLIILLDVAFRVKNIQQQINHVTVVIASGVVAKRLDFSATCRGFDPNTEKYSYVIQYCYSLDTVEVLGRGNITKAN